MKEIRTIVFDLGNIIVDVNYRRFTDFMAWDYERFLDFYHTPFFREYETGKKSTEEFFEEICKFLPVKKNDSEKYKDTIHLTFPIRYEIWGLVHFLRKYYPINLLSNTNALDFENLDKWMDLRAPFNHVFTSYEQGCLKPSAEIYTAAEAMFGYKGSEILFFDDRQENIDGALRAGWNAVKVEKSEDIFRTLVEYGLFCG